MQQSAPLPSPNFGDDARQALPDAGYGTGFRQSRASQMMAVPSRLEVSTFCPSGEKLTDVTSCVWPGSERISLPVLASQSLAVLSWLPVRTRVPSGEKATEVTAAVWPSSFMELATGVERPRSWPWHRRCR